MNLPADRLSLPVPPEAESIRIVILYENRNAAIRARKVVEQVAHAFEGEFQFETGAWSFGMFRAEHLREVVLRETDQAHLVLLAVECPATIPPEVVTGVMKRNSADLALLGPGNENVEMPALRSQLRLLAQDKTALERDSIPRFKPLVPPSLTAMESLYGPVHSQDRWGINE